MKGIVIGSVSNLFTAVMVLQLIEEGTINFHEKLAVFFPELPNADKITIRDLLYHRSGLHDYTEGTNFRDWMHNPKSHGDLLRIIKEKGADFVPDSRASYSNTNYLLLGYIIEQVCNMSYQIALKERIINKIGLSDTYYGNSIDISNNESSSFKYFDNKWKSEKETDLTIHGGAGSIVSTPTDLIQFISGLFTGKLNSKSSVEHMTTLIDDYGMGVFANQYGLQPSFGHNGRIEEFYSAVWYFPNEKLAIAYCTNGINYPRSDIIKGVLNICVNEQIEIPFSKSATSKPFDLDKYAGSYHSRQLPLIIFKRSDARLLLETQGRTFELEPIVENVFMHAPTGYFFEFDLKKGSLGVKETDNVYYFERK